MYVACKCVVTKSILRSVLRSVVCLSLSTFYMNNLYRYMNGMSVHVVIHVSAAITLYSVQAVMSQLSVQDQESIAKEQEKLEQEHKV